MKCPNPDCDSNKENIDWENTVKTCPLCKTELVVKPLPPTLPEYSNLKIEDYISLCDIIQKEKEEKLKIASLIDPIHIVTEKPVPEPKPEERPRIIITAPEIPAPEPAYIPPPKAIRTPEVVVDNTPEPKPEENKDFKIVIGTPEKSETFIYKIMKLVIKEEKLSTTPIKQPKTKRPWYSLTKTDILVLVSVLASISAMGWYYFRH